MATFASLAGKQFLQRREVSIAEWGGSFYLEEMSGATYQKIASVLTERFGQDFETAFSKHPMEFAAALLHHCLKDNDGQSPSEEWLLSQPIRILSDLAREAMELNRITVTEQEKIEKNSPAEESASSASHIH